MPLNIIEPNRTATAIRPLEQSSNYQKWINQNYRNIVIRGDFNPEAPEESDIEWDKYKNGELYPILTFKRSIDKTGPLVPQVMQMLKKPKQLNKLKLQQALDIAVFKEQPAPAPVSLLTYLGEPFGIGMTYEAMETWGAINDMMEPNNKWYFEVIVVPQEDSLSEARHLITKWKRKNSNTAGFISPSQIEEIWHKGNVPGLYCITNMMSFHYLMNERFSSEPRFARVINTFRAEDCPTTPDGSWKLYLEDLLAATSVPGFTPEESGPPPPEPEPEAAVEAPPEPEQAEPVPTAAVEAPEAPAPVAAVEAPTASQAPSALRRPRLVVGKKPPIWPGVNPEDIWQQVAQGLVPSETVEGDLRIWGPLKEVLVRERGPQGARQRTNERKAGARDITAKSLTQGMLSFLRPEDFQRCIQTRIYPNRHDLARRLGRPFPWILADIRTVTPAEWGSVPGLVGGDHIGGDRLCAVRVIWPDIVQRHLESGEKPFTYVYGGQVHELGYIPQAMIAFPTGWLHRRWGLLGGLYGSPLDPTLPSWWGDEKAPPENWFTQFLEWLPPTLPFDDIPPYPRADVEDLLSRLK
jgi:hypothetical protein